MNRKNVLGKGLSALIPDYREEKVEKKMEQKTFCCFSHLNIRTHEKIVFQLKIM